MGRTDCTEPQSLYSIAIPLLPIWVVLPVQYSYTSTSPMGHTASREPQCLYSTAINLLPLWTVLPVQSLRTCRVQLYLYTPYEPYRMYRASEIVQYSYTSTLPMDCSARTRPQCLYSIAISLLHFIYRTVSTEPQCLYSRAIPLLPLWTVQPVQVLSACTVDLLVYTPLFTVQVLRCFSACRVEL